MDMEIMTKGMNFLTVDGIHNAALRKESETLAALQDKIISGVMTLSESVETIRREQAKVLDRIQSTKLYEKDNFKSLAEYAETIGLNKSNAHALAAAGRIYNDKKAPQNLKDMSPSKLATLSAAIKADKDTVYTDAENGAFTGKTQSELKTYASERAASKQSSKVVKTYKCFDIYTGEQVNGTGESANGDYSFEEWTEFFKSNGAEVIKLPNAETTVTNAKTGEQTTKANIQRLLVIDRDSPKIYRFAAYTPKSNGDVKTSNARDTFIANAINAGMDKDSINKTCVVMGWEPLV